MWHAFQWCSCHSVYFIIALVIILEVFLYLNYLTLDLMTSRTFYFLDELVADFILRHMAKILKDTWPYIDSIVKLYQKYDNVLFGHSPPTQASSLIPVNNQPVFPPSPVNTSRSAEHDEEYDNPEILYQGPSTLLKRNPSTSSLQRRHSPFENANKEESQNVTASRDKQPFPAALRNTSDHEIDKPQYLPGDNRDDKAIQLKTTSRIPITTDKQRLPPKMRIKQLQPVKISENTTEHQNVPHKRLPVDQKHTENVEPVELETETPFRRSTVIISPQKMDRRRWNENTFDADQTFVGHVAQNSEMAVNSEVEKRSFESENRSLAEDSPPMANLNKHEENCFSPVKKFKILHNYPSNVQESGSSGENSRVLFRSDQDSELNISPDQGNDATEVFEEKRKFPCPRTDAMLFKYIPSYRMSSRGIEIEYDANWESEEIPSSESIFSPTNYKSSRTIINSNSRKRSEKDMFFSVDESKPGSSRDFSPSANSTLRISPTATKTNSLNRYDCINLQIDGVYCESSKGNHSVETASSPTINNLGPQTIANRIIQFSCKRQMRDKYIRQFFVSLSVFGEDLKHFYNFLLRIQDVVQFFFLKKDFLCEELKKTIVTLTTLCSNLLGKVSLWKMDIDLEYFNWVKYDKEIHKLREKYDPLLHNGCQTMATIEDLRVYEEHLKTTWKKIDETILNADSRRSLFLTTAVDLERLINLFVKFLITIGLLKPSPMTL